LLDTEFAVTTTDELLDLDVASRRSTVRFDLLDASLVRIGEIHPDRDQVPTIDNDTTRSIKRTLQNVFVRYDEAEFIDELTMRVAPFWVLENSREFPLGVFLFADAQRQRTTKGAVLSATLVDMCQILDQSDGVIVAYPAGQNVAAAIVAELRAGGITRFQVDPTGVAIDMTIAWAPTVTRLDRLTDLCNLAGFFPPYFDASGLCVCRGIGDPSLGDPTLTLDGIAYRNSIVERTDQLDAPNRYVVIGSGATDTPIVGIYDIPSALPWSAQNRGFISAHTETISGVADTQTANVMAQAMAARDGAGFRHIELDSAPDPRHDSFDLVTWDGDIWLETGWRLPLVEGGEHHHTLRSATLAA
jgi:hypothetical protein